MAPSFTCAHDGADARGCRCVFEQAVSSAAAAHVEQADHCEEGNGLPAHIARAQAARPKLTVLDGEVDAQVVGLGEPLTLLTRALAQLKTATFRGGDAERVMAQFLHLEWIMNTAMVRHARVARYGAALASVQRKSVLRRLSLFRRSIWEPSEAAPVAPPVPEPVHHDNQPSQARFDGDTPRQRSPRDSFIEDVEESRRRQSVRLDRPGRLNFNRPGRHPEPESELELAV